MSSEKDQELEKILTQLNSSIGGTKNGEQPGKKPVPKPENLPSSSNKPPVAGPKGGTPQNADGNNAARRRRKKRPPKGAGLPQVKPGTDEASPSKRPAEIHAEAGPTAGEKNQDPSSPIKPEGQGASKASPSGRVQMLDEGAPDMSEHPEPNMRHPAVRHIAVTAVEVIEDPKENRPLQEENVDPTKPLENIPRPQKMKQPGMSKKDRWTAIIGLLVTFFTVVGIISSVVGVTRFTGDIINSTAKKKELAREVYPLVIIDTPEFINPRLLDSSAIISASIWAFIIDDNDKSMYPKDDLGHIYVPDADIDLYVRRLFGGEVEIHHQSITDSNLQALYDSENKTYVLESTPKFLPYTPQVDTIERKGNVYTIDVSYVTPDAMWNMDVDNRSVNIDKVMQFVLRKNEDSYQVISATYIQKPVADNASAAEIPSNMLPDDPGFLDEESQMEELTSSVDAELSSEGSGSSGVSSEETDGEDEEEDEGETSSQPDTDSDEDPESRPEETSSDEDEK